MSRSIFVFALLTTLLLIPFSASAVFIYNVTVHDCDPGNMDTGASRVIGRGIYFNASCNGNYTVHAFLSDATSDHKLIAHETRLITNNASILVFFSDVIDWNQSYFFFIGIYEDATYTSANTQFSSSDGSVIPAEFCIDGTDYEAGDKMLLNTATYNPDFVGCYIFFEPGFQNSGGIIGAPTPGMLGQMVRDYGDDIGVPYFYLIIALLIAAIIALLPFSIAVHYDLNIPNFVYGIFIAVGVSLDFGIGLLDLWMFGMFILFATLSIILRYQEQIQKLVSRTETTKEIKTVTTPFAAITKGVLGVGARGASGLAARGKAVNLTRKLPFYARTGANISYSPEKAASYRLKHRKED